MIIDLDAIEARANAATPGPWTMSRSSDHPGERHIEAGLGAGVYVAMDVGADDAAFIAAARTDIPALIARVRQLEAERDERTRQHAARGAEAVAVIDALRVELAELRVREGALIAAVDADERAHRERAGLNTDGTMVHTAEAALSWLIAALFVERAASRIANEDMAELRATVANERGEGAGPVDGWTWDGNSCAWLYGLDAEGEYPDDGWTVEQTPAGQDLGWTWEHRGTRSDPYPYARDAMRAADLARAGGAT